MKSIIVLTFILWQSFAIAQKTVLSDTTDYTSWPSVANAKLSPLGRYACFDLYNTPAGKATTVLKATSGKWQKKFAEMGEYAFSSDDRTFYYVQDGILRALALGRTSERSIASASDFKLHRTNMFDFLIYRDDSLQCLAIERLGKIPKRSNLKAKEYKIFRNGTILLLKKYGSTDTTEELSLFDMLSGTERQIYKGVITSNLLLDVTGNNIAFTTPSGEGLQIWHFNKAFDSAKSILKDSQVGKDQYIDVNDVWEFSPDGSKLYLCLLPRSLKQTRQKVVPEIWDYRDKMVYPQFETRGFPQFREWRYLSSVDLENRSVTQLLFGNERKAHSTHKHGDMQFVIQTTDSVDRNVVPEKNARRSYYLVDERNQIRIPIKQSSIDPLYDLQFSPDNRFLTYMDGEEKAYKCFEIATRKTRSFTKSASSELHWYNERTRLPHEYPPAISCWIKGTNHVLMIGRNGIWELDVKGEMSPKKLTKSIPRHINMFFSFCDNFENDVIDPSSDLIIQGIDYETRDTYVFRMNINKGEFKRIYNGGFYWSEPYDDVPKIVFQKAEKTNSFLVTFPRADRTTNLIFTKDFERFDTLTSIYPESRYNWLTSELHNYVDSLGNNCQGVLYKPENFDPHRKYPVIFYFYQEAARNLHLPIAPSPVPNGLNIPHLVSNGYIVFCPDMYSMKGKIGEYALLSINAAADHLSGFDWIDTHRMGIAGHSFGGFEVNYIVTHTNRFAAALSGASISSLVNFSLDLWGPKMETTSYVQSIMMMGDSFEDNPQSYIDNSAIFAVKNVKTPMFLLNSEDDPSTAFYQGSQFYLALRRLGKPVWLVNYKTGGHGVGSYQNRLDYMRKCKEFFDHYLKDAAAPDWMNKPIE